MGTGDVQAIEAIAARRQAATQPEQAAGAAPAAEDGMLVGEAKARPNRRFFGIGKAEDGPVAADSAKLSKDNRALLQETLFDLLECKRLLDQVR